MLSREMVLIVAACFFHSAWAASVVQFASTNVVVAEDGGSISLSLIREGDPGQPADVAYSTASALAASGTDFVARSGTVTFAPGEATQTISISISIMDDAEAEGLESFTVTLSAPGATPIIGDNSVATVWIKDNEIPTLNDPSFNPPSFQLPPERIFPLTDGSILVVGNFNVPNGTLRLIRLRPDGTRDSTFVPPYSATPGFNDAVADPDGTVWIAGIGSVLAGRSSIFLDHLDSKGHRIKGLSMLASSPTGAPYPQMRILPERTLVMAGDFTVLNNVRYSGIAKVNLDGSIDDVFVASAPAISQVQEDEPDIYDPVFVSQLLLQADGKLVLLGGFNRVNGVPHPGVLRLAADGTMDDSFTLTDGSGSLLPLPDGRFILSASNCISRLQSDGTVDPSFKMFCGEGTARDVTPDGMILVAKTEDTPVLLFLDSDGNLKRKLALPGNNITTVSPLISGPNGSIYVSTYGGDITLNFPLARLLPDQIQRPGLFFDPSAAVAEEGGAVSLTVARSGNVGSELTVECVTLDGSAKANRDYLATVETVHFAPSQIRAGVTLGLPNDLIVNSDRDFKVTFTNVPPNLILGAGPSNATIRLLDDDRPGSVDSSFKSFLPLSASTTRQFRSVSLLKRQEDGKILVAGSFAFTNESTGLPTSIVRLNSEGSLDRTFAATVPFVFRSAVPASHINALIPYPDGRVLIAGSGTNFVVGDELRHSIARVGPDGGVDRVFSPGDESWMEGLAIALQSDNKILLGGRKLENSAYSILFHRLESNGSIDTSFNPQLDPSEHISVEEICLQPDQKILVVTSLPADPQSRFSLQRLLPDGSLDSTFTPLSETYQRTYDLSSPFELVVQNDGKILFAGTFFSLSGSPGSIFRLKPDGKIDISFRFGSGFAGTGPTIVPDPSGFIWVAGSTFYPQSGGSYRVGVARLFPDGTLDPAFDTRLVLIGGPGGQVQAVLPLNDGNILVGGSFSAFGDAPASSLVRLRGDVPPAITGIRPSPFGVTLRVMPGRKYALETSEDLQSWRAIRTNTVASAYSLNLEDAEAPQYKKRFYRARLVAP